jgi:hypothetical protein
MTVSWARAAPCVAATCWNVLQSEATFFSVVNPSPSFDAAPPTISPEVPAHG